MKTKHKLKRMLDFLLPTLEQANDVKVWADERIRRLKGKRRKERAA